MSRDPSPTGCCKPCCQPSAVASATSIYLPVAASYPEFVLKKSIAYVQRMQKIFSSNKGLLVNANTLSQSHGDSNDNINENPDDFWYSRESCFSELPYMDLDEFLTENGIPIDKGCKASSISKSLTSSGPDLFRNSLPTCGSESLDGDMADSVVNTPFSYQSPVEIERRIDDEYSNASESSSNSAELDTVTRSSLEKLARPSEGSGRSQRNNFSTSCSFDNTSYDDSHSLFGLYGEDFNPESRQFSPDDVHPQPMFKKQYVPDGLRDDKYLARPRKNNMVAKRSCVARQVKKNQIAMRANFLDKDVVSALFQLTLNPPLK